MVHGEFTRKEFTSATNDQQRGGHRGLWATGAWRQVLGTCRSKLGRCGDEHCLSPLAERGSDIIQSHEELGERIANGGNQMGQTSLFGLKLLVD